MSRALYIDCIGGCAGDMLLAALIDCGADETRIAAGLEKLPVDGIELKLSSVERCGIRAAQVSVLAEDAERREGHRTLDDVLGIVERAQLGERARAIAVEAFGRLADAEAAVHGVTPQEVRFHEVGALDAIADVCGVALAVEELEPGRVVCSPLPAGRGSIDSVHGRLPLPAPATLELLRDKPLYGVDVDVELVTPTGAALVATLADEFGPLPPIVLESVGYGAGARDLDELPNVVRALVGQTAGLDASVVSLIETNIDDLSPELVPDAAHACFAAGALDVWSTAVQMKKGRPGIVLSALARLRDEQRVAQALLRETSTLGIRISQLRRWELDREQRIVEVAGEPVRVKLGRLDGEVINVAPEHDDCAAVAARTGRTVKSVWGAAFAAVHEELAGDRRDRTASA